MTQRQCDRAVRGEDADKGFVCADCAELQPKGTHFVWSALLPAGRTIDGEEQYLRFPLCDVCARKRRMFAE
jgi:hypothetical protein